MAILKAVGIGKHSRDEIIYIGNEDLRAISHYLGSKHYFTGFKPTRVSESSATHLFSRSSLMAGSGQDANYYASKVDATLFGVLAQIVYAPYDLPQKKIIMDELTNLKEYCDRIRGRYWPDWDECTTKLTMSSDWKKKV
uniref:Metaxin glutathione S-transferase domain-containing protein n=1 Tax=Parascaris equorum TaxID=6256 RepID=A0A914S3Q4_PAREQ